MPRDNRFMYRVHVCLYVCCSDCVGVCGNVCCVAVVNDSEFVGLGVLNSVECCVRGVMDVVFAVCIVTCGSIDARVWEV